MSTSSSPRLHLDSWLARTARRTMELILSNRGVLCSTAFGLGVRWKATSSPPVVQSILQAEECTASRCRAASLIISVSISLRLASNSTDDCLATRWNFVNFQSPTYSAIMMDFTTPPSYGSTTVTVGGIATDGKLIYAGTNNTAEHVEIQQDPEARWPEPTTTSYWWKGTSPDGKPVEGHLHFLILNVKQ